MYLTNFHLRIRSRNVCDQVGTSKPIFIFNAKWSKSYSQINNSHDMFFFLTKSLNRRANSNSNLWIRNKGDNPGR